MFRKTEQTKSIDITYFPSMSYQYTVCSYSSDIKTILKEFYLSDLPMSLTLCLFMLKVLSLPRHKPAFTPLLKTVKSLVYRSSHFLNIHAWCITSLSFICFNLYPSQLTYFFFYIFFQKRSKEYQNYISVSFYKN